MSTEQSRFAPQNQFWYEDLVAREAPLAEGRDADGPSMGEDLNRVDDECLEVSRESTLIRGGLLLYALAMSILAIYAAPLVIEGFVYDFFEIVYLSIFFWIMVFFMFGMIFLMIRRDCRTPRDTPVRFNRKTGKVEACEFLSNYNPFGRWRSVIKTFDWDTVQAEITKQAGFNGKVYMVRHALELVICKPGTNEVVERIVLKANDVTGLGLYSKWAYIRRYMAEGMVNLPQQPVRKQDISFRRSFFMYMPYLDPTKEGSEYRSKMVIWDFFFPLLTIWLFWLWIPMGICQYIAMRLAPEPKWHTAEVVDITPV